MELAISFVLGVVSSVTATYLMIMRGQLRYSLRFQSIIRLIHKLRQEIENDSFSYEYILALGRNSGVIASVLAGFSGTRSALTVTLLKERLSTGERTIAFDDFGEVMVSHLTGKRVLVIICCNDSGASLQYAVEKLKLSNVAELRTAALYSSPSPSFKPDYASVIVGRDTKLTMSEILARLPWARPGWVHPFAKEREFKPREL